MPTKKAAAPSPSGKRLNREKILHELRTNRSYKGGSSTDRKALFDVKVPCKIWVLPDLKDRGDEDNPLPYLDLSVHWMDRPGKDGKTFPSGIMCVDALMDYAPRTFQRFLTEKLVKDERCPVCELLSAFDADDFPQGTYGSPRIAPQRGYYFQVLKEEDQSRGDTHPIKIFKATATGKDNFMALVADEDIPGAAAFETDGIFTSWNKSPDGKSYQVAALNQKKIWLKDWQKKLLDLELITPVFMGREEMLPILVSNLPQFKVAEFFNLNGVVKKAEAVEKKAPKRKAAAK